MRVKNDVDSSYKIKPILFIWLVVLLLSFLAALAIFEIFSEDFSLTSRDSFAYFLVFFIIAILIYIYSYSYSYSRKNEEVNIYRFGKLIGTYHFNKIIKINTGGRLNHWCWLELTFCDSTKVTVDSFYKNEFKFYTDVYSYITRVEYPLSDKQKKWFDDLNKVR